METKIGCNASGSVPIKRDVDFYEWKARGSTMEARCAAYGLRKSREFFAIFIGNDV